nr:reverse transcriptase domain-containing protein [Tanacetum cinerariifolium]
DNNIPAYSNRFQELALICTKFVSNETEKVDKYISGLPDNIYGNVKSSKPKTLDETIELANDLMDQKLRTYAERKSDGKRKVDDISRNNQQPFKKQNVAKAYNLDLLRKRPMRKCAQVHQVPTQSLWPVHSKVSQMRENNTLCPRLQEHWQHQCY